MNSSNVPQPKALLSVVLGSYKRKSFLIHTINSIRKELKRLEFKTEIIVVDGGSDDGTINWLTKQKDIISIIQHNRGEWKGEKIDRRSWGYFMNLGFRAAEGKYICMLSDDCLVFQNAIFNAYHLFEEREKSGEKVGAIAFYFRNLPVENEFAVNFTIDNTMMINHGIFLKKALEDVDYIDDENFRFYHADDDLALKIKEKGYIITDSPHSFIDHFLHANIILREQVYETERDDFDSLINKWSASFQIPENRIIHSSKKVTVELHHEYISYFYSFYRRELYKLKAIRTLNLFLYNFRRKIKVFFSMIYYILIYITSSLKLLVTDRNKLKEKMNRTFIKYRITPKR